MVKKIKPKIEYKWELGNKKFPQRGLLISVSWIDEENLYQQKLLFFPVKTLKEWLKKEV